MNSPSVRIGLRYLGIVLGLAYPFLVYFGIQHFNASTFALIIVIAIALRSLSSRSLLNAWQIASLGVLLGYSLLAALVNSKTLLLYYPVISSVCVAWVFFISLRDTQPLIEKIAERAGETILPEVKAYLFWLTLIWGIILTLNALVAAYTACCLSLVQWTLYNGLISYFVMGAFLGLEYIFRRYYKAYRLKKEAL